MNRKVIKERVRRRKFIRFLNGGKGKMSITSRTIFGITTDVVKMKNGSMFLITESGKEYVGKIRLRTFFRGGF